MRFVTYMMVVMACIIGMSMTVDARDAKKKMRPGECEVCMGVMDKLKKAVPTGTSETDAIQTIKEQCAELSERDAKERTFCYNVGALESSASTMLKEIARPLTIGMPSSVACKKLAKKDESVCSLRYEKAIDLDQDLMKLRVGDLRRILTKWGEKCEGCSEKKAYVDLIKKLRPKYDKEYKEEL